jgi:hypothetical protein
MPRRINYKARIVDILRIERVAYGMEIARRIDVYRHRTIKYVLKAMCEDGELERSEVERVDGNIKIIFYFLPETDYYTVSRVSEFKKHLLLEHLEYSNVQKNFGPKLAISSLKDLAINNLLPLTPNNIRGPITKWAGPNKAWRENPVAVAYGDIDIIGLERRGNIMWIGEVKMRGDILKKVQAEHFLATAKRFRKRVFVEKGIFFHLKPFLLAPLASVSARNFCREEKIELIECEKVYYPEKTAVRKLGDFYRLYREVMGVPNLKVVSYDDLPIENISQKIREKNFRETI